MILGNLEAVTVQGQGKKLLIVGAGPTGLGAAYRLKQLGYDNWLICERNSYVGGLAASFRDDKGFTWDIGGHVVFSHYPEFDRFFEEMTGGEHYSHIRKSYVRIAQVYVPYYFQNNIRYLPAELRDECLRGLEEVAQRQSPPDTSNFLAWCKTFFGEGITRIFMRPDNEKRWGYPLDQMSANWVADRISPVNIEQVRRNIREERDDVAWGPNSRFAFPKRGGTGSIFEAVVPVIQDKLCLKREAVHINASKMEVTFSDGSTETYDHLLNTMPLDHLMQRITDAPEDLRPQSEGLAHCNSLIVGLGFSKPNDSDRCWIYCPEKAAPFYRVTNFSHYSPHNAPDMNHSSLMCDVSYSGYLRQEKDSIIEQTIDGLVAVGMIQKHDRQHIISRYLIDAPYSYPIPSLKRDKILRDLQLFLESRNIQSRGRFGAWLYEIGNMDDCVMMGMQWANRILQGESESVWINRR